MCYELSSRKIAFERQKPLPLEYKGIKLDCGYRVDIIVNGKVLLELKCVEKILPIHEAQLLTYLKLSKLHLGLILNFHTPLMKSGIKRMAL